MDRYTEFLNRWAADAERLHRVGIIPFGFDPGCVCHIKGCPRSVDIPAPLVDIICKLVKKVYPETEDDEAMIKAYEGRYARFEPTKGG